MQQSSGNTQQSVVWCTDMTPDKNTAEKDIVHVRTALSFYTTSHHIKFAHGFNEVVATLDVLQLAGVGLQGGGEKS